MQQSGQRAGAVGEAFHGRPERIQHGDVQVGGRGIFTVDQVLSAIDAAAGATAQHERQLMRIVAVPVNQRRSNRIIELSRTVESPSFMLRNFRSKYAYCSMCQRLMS